MPSVSKAQHNLMAGVAHNPAFAKKVGIKQSVGRDFVDADKGKKFAQGGQVAYDANDGMHDDSWMWGPNTAFAEGGQVDDISTRMLKEGGRTYKAPTKTKIPGHGEVDTPPLKPLQEAGNAYMRFRGKTHEPVTEYPMFDEDRARRIAEAYETMKHAPGDPKVKRAYDAMIEETLGQYKAIKDAGYDFTFNKPGEGDPYAASPALGYLDLRDRGHLSVFPTDSGFGTLGELDVSANPLLKRVGRVGDLPNATANDAFRIVHDAFGHFGPGNPFFRHKGEERAWLNHARMYSPEALPAMTSETRGQNSWLNFGPYGEKNRTASSDDTVFADQKSGLMRPFTWEETGYAGGGRVKKGLRNVEFVDNLDDVFGGQARSAGDLVRAHTARTGKEGGSFGNEFFHTPLIRGERDRLDFNSGPRAFTDFIVDMHRQQIPAFSVHSHPILGFGGRPMVSQAESMRLMDGKYGGGPLFPSPADLYQHRMWPHTMMIESGGLSNNRLMMEPMDSRVDPSAPTKLLNYVADEGAPTSFAKRLVDFNTGAGLRATDTLPYELLINQGLAERGVPISIDSRAQSGLGGRGDVMLARDLLPDFQGYLSRHNAEPF